MAKEEEDLKANRAKAIQQIVILIDRLVKSYDDRLNGREHLREIVPLLTEFQEIDEGYATIDVARKRLYAVLNRADKNSVPEALENEGVDKIAIPSLKRSYYVLNRYSASMLDKEGVFSWLREQGAEALITETVNAGTLAAYLKERTIKEGVDPPDELIKFTEYKIVGSSKYTPKQ